MQKVDRKLFLADDMANMAEGRIFIQLRGKTQKLKID
jgi:hypothetical protein